MTIGLALDWVDPFYKTKTFLYRFDLLNHNQSSIKSFDDWFKKNIKVVQQFE